MPLALPHSLGLPYLHHQLVLSCYHHQPESHQVSQQKVYSLRDIGPIDRTPGTPGSDKKLPRCNVVNNILAKILQTEKGATKRNLKVLAVFARKLFFSIVSSKRVVKCVVKDEKCWPLLSHNDTVGVFKEMQRTFCSGKGTRFCPSCPTSAGWTHIRWRCSILKTVQ